MKIFKRSKIWIYISFIAVSIAAVVVICFNNFSTNILLGNWETADGMRKYCFDENTVTISSAVNDYSEFYGYYLKDKSTFVLQKGDKQVIYKFEISGAEISIYSAESDSPEILHRV